MTIRQRTVSGVSLIEVPVDHEEASFSGAVAEGLCKAEKSLPCRFFYDAIGSELFEQICIQPEYYPTRTERNILLSHARDIIAAVGNQTHQNNRQREKVEAAGLPAAPFDPPPPAPPPIRRTQACRGAGRDEWSPPHRTLACGVLGEGLGVKRAGMPVGAVFVALVEFGSGSSLKTRILIEALLARQPHLDYTPIDISSDFLLDASRTLLSEYNARSSILSITAIAAEYHDALRALPNLHDQPRLFIFLGSNIGNFDQQEAVALLAKMAHQMRAEDRLLIGFDLVKERDILLAAYDDAAGATKAFNKNLLARINRDLGGDFDLDQFAHDVCFVEEDAYIKVGLISRCRQRVYIEALEQSVEFEEGEYIHTSDSHKYTEQRITSLAEAAGLVVQTQWTDEKSWFSLTLLRKK